MHVDLRDGVRQHNVTGPTLLDGVRGGATLTCLCRASVVRTKSVWEMLNTENAWRKVADMLSQKAWGLAPAAAALSWICAREAVGEHGGSLATQV